jgi:hypothetical protein
MCHGGILERAQFFAAQPLGGFHLIGEVHGGQSGEIRQKVAQEEQETADQAQPLDDVKAGLELARTIEGAVEAVGEIRLQANVQEAAQCQHLVQCVLTNRVIQTLGQREPVLNGLQKLLIWWAIPDERGGENTRLG